MHVTILGVSVHLFPFSSTSLKKKKKMDEFAFPLVVQLHQKFGSPRRLQEIVPI